MQKRFYTDKKAPAGHGTAQESAQAATRNVCKCGFLRKSRAKASAISCSGCAENVQVPAADEVNELCMYPSLD